MENTVEAVETIETETVKVDVPTTSTSIGPKSVRKMALLLLDDENGISVNAYSLLSAMLVESGNEDILEKVDITENDRVYLGEDWTEEQLAKLAKLEEFETEGADD